MVLFALVYLGLQKLIFLCLRHTREILLNYFFLLSTLIRGTRRHLTDFIELLDVSTQNTLKKASRITTEQNVGAATSHVRRDGYGLATSCLGDNLCFTLVVL